MPISTLLAKARQCCLRHEYTQQICVSVCTRVKITSLLGLLHCRFAFGYHYKPTVIIYAETTTMSDDDSNSKDEMIEELKPIDKWDASAVKNRLDDSVRYYITQELKYKENFFLIDLRLIISSAAVGVAAFALIWDWFHPFPQSRPVLLSCVLLYFVFMILLTVYTNFVEKGTIFQAYKNNKVFDFSFDLPINLLEQQLD